MGFWEYQKLYFKKNVKIPFYLLFFKEYHYDEDMIRLKLKKVSYKKVFNYIKSSLNRDFKTKYMWGYPHILQINPYLGCNLRCVGCPAHEKNKKITKGPLSLEIFKKLIDEVGDYILHLNFWSWGEPFLNKDLPEMISYAKEKNMIIRTSTNCNLLDDDEYNERILKSGLDELILALDGTKNETYIKFRKGGDFHKVIRGIEKIVKMKSELGLNKPLLNLRMVVTSYNEQEIPEIKELAIRLGVDVLTFKTVNTNQNLSTPKNNLLPKNKKYHCYSYDPISGEKIEPKKWFCYFPWFETTLFNDGSIVPCEFDFHAEHAFGNIKNQSFREIWFGEKANQFREQYVKNKDVFVFCKKCYYKGIIIDSCVAEKIEIKK